MKHLIAAHILSASRLREVLVDWHATGEAQNHAPEQYSTALIARYVFVALKERMPFKPDYSFELPMAWFFEPEHSATVLLNALNWLSDDLELSGHAIYVKRQRWQQWQETLLQVPPLLLICARFSQHFLVERHFRLLDLQPLFQQISATCLPSVYLPDLEQRIFKQGIADLHIHLNGSIETDLLWGGVLQRPQAFLNEYVKAKSNNKVNDHMAQRHASVDDVDLVLRQAQLDRNWLAGQLREWFPEPFLSEPLLSEPFLSAMGNSGDLLPWQQEAMFFCLCLSCLRSDPSMDFVSRFHRYLLCYQHFHQLLVQQQQDIGFDQFQKITVNEMRSSTEASAQSYTQRFAQLQGMHDTPLTFLEGRFSPKSSLRKNKDIVDKITKGYRHYVGCEQPAGGALNIDRIASSAPASQPLSHRPSSQQHAMELTLVAHFIKKLPPKLERFAAGYRHGSLRSELDNNKLALARLMPAVRNASWQPERIAYVDEGVEDRVNITGFDAAANEFHAAPEVFAPVFRQLRFSGQRNFTYHAGEDFKHLVSGIRAVYEAVEFLELSTGNRIGHATALGIEPNLWQRRFARDQVMNLEKGEWLDNLVFAYDVFSQQVNGRQMDGAPQGLLGNLQRRIDSLFKELYQFTEHVPLDYLVEAWRMRKLMPELLTNSREARLFDDFEQREQQLISGKYSDLAKRICCAYHSPDVVKRSEEIIEIAPFEIMEAESIRALQNRVVEHLNHKGVAIESLFSSNVRVSFYKRYQEHHLFRWLGLARETDPCPAVVLGSDDTGIFMTNIRNEYSYVYLVLCERAGATKAMQLIEALWKNAEAYRFKAA